MLGKIGCREVVCDEVHFCIVGVPVLRRIAGVNAFNYNQLKSISENKTILQTIIEIAQHQVIRAR